MSPTSRRLLTVIALCTGFGSVATFCLLGPTPAKAQESAPAKAAKADAPPKAADPDENVIREQSIYVPYEKLRKVFEKEGRGVFLPYEKFRELWKAAHERIERPALQKPPLGAVVTEIESEAVVAKDVVTVTAVLKIELIAEGWNQVPLRLADAAITRATLDDQPARIVADGPRGYKLVVEKKGKDPKRVELRLEYAKAIARSPGRNSVSLEAPRAPVNRWRVRIPESGVKVNIHPAIAAAETKPDAAAAAAKPNPDETVVLAFVGAAPTVRIDWTPKAEGATGLAALASVQTRQQVSVGEGVTRTRTDLAYSISRAELNRLVIEVPADQKVANVFDPNVSKWSVKGPAAERKTQQIEVQLFEPAKGSQNLTVELEKFTGDADKGPLEIPVVRAVDAGRQQGVVVVRVAEGLRAEATTRTGLLQVDFGELPKELTGAKWTFAYRYATVPYALVLNVEKVLPHVVADSLVEAYLEPGSLEVDVLTVYTIERAGAFKLTLDVPAGFEIRRVEGRAAAGAVAAQVDGHHTEGENKGRLIVNLARKAFGRVGLVVTLHKDLELPELRSPTDQPANIPLPFARVAPGTAQRATGRLIVFAPESLRVNPDKAEGLRSISFAEALDGMEPVRPKKPEDARPVLAFAFTQQPATLVLDARRRKPQVTIRQLLVVRIDEGVVKYEATLFHDVLYSGVKSLRIDVPAAVSAKLRNLSGSAGIDDKIVVPAPEDLAEGYVAWNLTGKNELLGSGSIELAWEETLDKLDFGQPSTLAVPRLVPKGVDRAWGQIVLTKSETIDVRETGESRGLRGIDPQHELMPGAEVTGAARAFEFHDDWALSVEATRYELEEVKRTAIERAALRTVVTRAGQINVQALYRMQSTRQRLAVRLPPQAQFDTQPLRVNGEAVPLESGDKQQNLYFIPVPAVDPNSDNRNFVLELRYAVPVPEEGLRLDLPEFPEEPALQKVYLCVYLPEETALLAAVGPWTEEFHWIPDDCLHWRAGHRLMPPVGWVTEGVKVSGDPATTFQTDGQVFVFSSLSPESAPGGSLRLHTIDRLPLNVAVFVLVIVGGLLLVPAGAGLRAVAVGLLLIALVICGVFAPMFAMQVANGELAAAVCIVLVIWIVWYFVRRGPRRAEPETETSAPDPAPQPPTGEEPPPVAEAAVPAADEPPPPLPWEQGQEPPGDGPHPEEASGEEPARPILFDDGPDDEPAEGDGGEGDDDSGKGGETDA